MAKAQGKKAAATGKSAAKKVAAGVKKAVAAVKKKVAPKKKAATPPKPPAKKKPAPKPVAKKPVTKPAKGKVKASAKKVVKSATKKAVKAAKPIVKAAAKAAVKAAKAAVVAKMGPTKVAAVKTAVAVAKTMKASSAPKAPKAAAAPAAAATPAAAPAPRPAPAAEEKKRGRRARPRVHSSGAPAAAWLSTEKPRPASFIPAPARAEAPSAVAAPPASSDRLIRPDDVDHPAVRTVPVRIDVEQSAGRYYVIANPIEASVRPGEGIEWDFRYIGGADVSVEEIVVEFDKPSPFAQAVFRTRKPGGARPHRQLSNGALPAAVGRHIEYTVRAINPYKTELARTKVWLNVTA